jgi:Zn2+/Cd2+-exporting ATPase
MSESRAFKISGLDCAEEVAVLKREIGPLVGGEDLLEFDVLRAKMTVLAPAQVAKDSAIVAAVRRTGMRAEAWLEGSKGDQTAVVQGRRARLAMTCGSALATAAGFAVHAAQAGVLTAFGSEGLGEAAGPPLLARGLYLAGVVLGSWVVLPKALHSARRLRPDMNLLMTVAVIGAVAIGEWFEAATVSFLFAVSLALEAWSVGRARRAIDALLDLAPPTVHGLDDAGVTTEIAAGELAIGGRFLIKPGERIALDAVVVGGQSHVNQAPITGESLPVEKTVGSALFAGTVNGDGALTAQSTRPVEQTLLAGILRAVAVAQRNRSPAEQWVERFARIYTPTVMVVAALVLLVPPLFLGGDWQEWTYRALVLLVISCPCALVISTPVSIVAAMTAAAGQGVVLKGGLFVELPARLRALAIDKTGTLTHGRPEVIEVVPLAGHTGPELVALAAALEARSDHPLARAVLEHARILGVRFEAAEDFQILPGKGATARLSGAEYWLGSHRYLEERGLETPEVHARLAAMSDAGRSVVVVGTADHVCGLIGVADAVHPEAGTALRELARLGIEHIVMLTGDNAGTARAVGAAVGANEVRAELLPDDKVRAIEELLTRYGAVGMVGDGVNDAPAMARATLSIAMGGAGSDAAIETADITLMADDLRKLPWLIRHSRRSLRVIRQNIGFSLAVKAVFALLTLGGFASLWAAIAADMGASLLVVFNGLRLLRTKASGQSR